MNFFLFNKKLKFWLTIVFDFENFDKSGDFDQKWKFWSKIEILVKNPRLLKNRNFIKKNPILFKNRNFIFKNPILFKNRNFI